MKVFIYIIGELAPESRGCETKISCVVNGYITEASAKGGKE